MAINAAIFARNLRPRRLIRIIGAVMRRLCRREQGRPGAAEWGRDDCVSYIFGIDFDRPECIRTPTQEAAFVAAVKQYGGVGAMCDEFARRGAYRRVTDGSRCIGDVVVGSTIYDAFCIAKIDGSYLPIARSNLGFDVIQFVDIIGVWRRVTPSPN